MKQYKGVMLWIIIFFGFGVGSIVLGANTPHPSMNETMFNIISLIQPLLKMLYVIMRPLLVIAGSALDNTFVYAKFIHLDSSLWQIWNVCKNFANFGLGFFVIIQIFKYVFREGKTEKVKEVLTNALLAGVGIQFSRFALGALVDLSTILVYSVGSLPMTLMNETKLGDRPILGVKTYMDMSNGGDVNTIKDSYLYYYTRGEYNFSPCKEIHGFVIGPMYTNIKNNNVTFNKVRCYHNNGMMVRYGQEKGSNKPGITYLAKSVHTKINGTEVPLTIAQKTKQIKAKINATFFSKDDADNQRSNDDLKNVNLDGVVYVGYPNTTFTINGETGHSLSDLKNTYHIKPLSDMQHDNGAYDRQVLFNTKCSEETDKNNGGCFYKKGTYLGNLLQDSKGFVGPLVTLYTSLLNFSDLHITTVGGGADRDTYAAFFEFILKAASAVVIIFPLISMAIVFIARVGLLRIVIATSPILVLIRVFKETYTKDVDKIESGKNFFNRKQVIGLIFSPVLPVFVLSLSLLFLTTLQASFSDQKHSTIRKGLGLTVEHQEGTNEQCLSVFGLFETCYDVGSEHQGGSFYIDLFAWLIMNGFGIAIVWLLMWMSLNQNDFTKGIANKIETLSSKALGSVPILPTPNGAVGLSAAKQFISKDAPNWLERDVLDKKVREDASKLKRDAGISDTAEQDKALKNAADKLKRANENTDFKAIEREYNSHVSSDKQVNLNTYNGIKQIKDRGDATTNLTDDNINDSEFKNMTNYVIKRNIKDNNAKDLKTFVDNKMSQQIRTLGGGETIGDTTKNHLKRNPTTNTYERVNKDGNPINTDETFDITTFAKTTEGRGNGEFDKNKPEHWKKVYTAHGITTDNKEKVKKAYQTYINDKIDNITKKTDFETLLTDEINKTSINGLEFGEYTLDDNKTYEIKETPAGTYTLQEKTTS